MNSRSRLRLMCNFVALEDLFRLLPALQELEGLRAAMLAAAVPQPDKEWASSSAYTTVDKRVLSREAVERTLASAERDAVEQVTMLFGKLRDLFEHHWKGDEAATAYDLISLGESEEGRNAAPRARILYSAALVLSLPLADKRPQIHALRRVARVLWHQGELDEAREYYARSAELAEAAEEFRSRVIAGIGIGNVLLFQGRWGEAEVTYRNTLDLLDGVVGTDLQLERGQLYTNLGSVMSRQGGLDEAEEWLSRARELFQRVDSPVDLAVCYHNIGLLRIQQGRLGEAREVLLAALNLPILPSLRSVVATDLGDVFLREGLLSQAEEWAREAETQALASASPYQMSHMYRGLGNVARARADDGGITFFEKAVEIARENGQWIAEGEALVDYALLRAGMGDNDEAISYLHRADELFAQLGAEHERERVSAVIAAVAPSLPVAAAGD